MTVSELRTLVDNFEEYIHVPGGIDRLKKMALHLAVSGQLVPQNPSDGTGEELYREIQAEKAELVKRRKVKKQAVPLEINGDEVPFEIPESWSWTRLGGITTVIGDGLHGTPVYSKGEYFFINGNNLEDDKIRIKTETKTVSSDEYDKLKKPLGNQSILLSINGTLGNVAYYNDEKLVLGKSAAYINLHNHVYRYFIGTTLKSPYARDYFISSKTGTTIYNLGLKALREMPFPLPPLAEQKRIVAKVDSIFVLIDQLSVAYKAEQAERTKLVASSLAQLAKAENDVEGSIALTHLSEIIRTKADAKILRQTILHLAISGQLVPQDPSEGTGEELYRQIQAEKAELVKHGKIKIQKPLPEITEDGIPFKVKHNWLPVRLGDLVWLEQGEKLSGEKMNYLQAKYLRGTAEPTIKTNGQVVDKGNRIILVDGENSGEVFITPERGYMGSTFKILGRAPLMDMEYVDIILRNLKDEMRENKIGAAIPHLDKKLFRNKIVGLPPLAEQKRIVDKTTQLLDLVSGLERHLEK